MKIKNIISYPVWIGSRNQLLVKVETDNGLAGWGESGLSSRELAVSGIIQHYKRFTSSYLKSHFGNNRKAIFSLKISNIVNVHIMQSKTMNVSQVSLNS